MISGLYKIENKDDGKLYVGSAINIPKRLAKHRTMLRSGRHQNMHLQSAWDKSGETAFTFSALLICSAQNLLFYEQRALDVYPDSYNIARVAGSQLGFRHLDEVKAKMAAAKVGTKQSPEHIAKRSAALMGHKVSDHCRAAVSLRWRGVPKSPELRAKLRLAKLGKPQSKESVARRAASNTGKKRSPESLARMSLAQQKRWRS